MKVPPHSIESEQSVIWSILIDSECLIQVSWFLLSEDFYEKHHQIIYEQLIELFNQNKAIDLITVKDKLESVKKLDQVGWISYLAELADIVPLTSNIWEYAQIVKNKSILRKLIRSSHEIWALWYAEDENIESLLEKSEKSLFNVTQTFINKKLVPIQSILTDRYEEFSELHENPDQITQKRLHLWYPSLDNKLWGLKGWDLAIVAARPSMWKTALSLNFAQNCSFKGKKVAIFSLEMSKEQLTDRMIASAMGIDSWKLGKWELTDEEFNWIGDAMEKLNDAKIFIDDSAGWRLIEMKSKARRLMIESWLDLIIIDYLQLMSNGNSQNRVQEISEISRGIKELARELDIPIIALSQLSRSVESRPDKRPILSDLRESWSIEQDADIVMMLYREDYYDEFSDKKGVTDIFVRKNRNWPIGSSSLMFEKMKQKFVEIELHRTPDQ